MERRAFLNFAVKRARAPARSFAQWIRPPHALPELHFLALCTRCDDCIPACPYQVIFKLPESAGRLAAGTPALNLLNRGCQMCADTPCVTACKPGALQHASDPHAAEAEHNAPETGDPDEGVSAPFPKMAIATVDEQTCLPYSGPECGACAHSCPVDGAMRWEGGVRPVINTDACTGCAMCREACIVSPKAIHITAIPTAIQS